jgi:hypothetical protein
LSGGTPPAATNIAGTVVTKRSSMIRGLVSARYAAATWRTRVSSLLRRTALTPRSTRAIRSSSAATRPGASMLVTGSTHSLCRRLWSLATPIFRTASVSSREQYRRKPQSPRLSLGPGAGIDTHLAEFLDRQCASSVRRADPYIPDRSAPDRLALSGLPHQQPVEPFRKDLLARECDRYRHLRRGSP